MFEPRPLSPGQHTLHHESAYLRKPGRVAEAGNRFSSCGLRLSAEPVLRGLRLHLATSLAQLSLVGSR